MFQPNCIIQKVFQSNPVPSHQLVLLRLEFFISRGDMRELTFFLFQPYPLKHHSHPRLDLAVLGVLTGGVIRWHSVAYAGGGAQGLFPHPPNKQLRCTCVCVCILLLLGVYRWLHTFRELYFKQFPWLSPRTPR